MVIEEKELLKAMKDAKKTCGYYVALKNDDEDSEIIIQVPGRWKVTVLQQNISRKVLGLITEHLGKFMSPGDAYQVKKKEPQTVIYSIATDSFMDDETEAQTPVRIRRTDLDYQGAGLWQRDGDNKMFCIAPELEDMMDSHGRNVYIHGDKVISITGAVSSVFVIPANMGSDSGKMDHLSGIRWVPEI